MSNLATASGRLDWEQRQLRELNTALLAMEAEALDRADRMGFTPIQIQTGRRILSEFIDNLNKAILGDEPAAPFQSLAEKLKSSPIPFDDWKADLQSLGRGLELTKPIEERFIPVIEELLSLLDSDFALELNRLYGH